MNVRQPGHHTIIRSSMSLTVSQGEGLTVITITSNPKSKWPVLCQILGFLCNSPGCFAPQHMKGNLKDVHIALGFLVAGIVCILGTKFTSSCLVVKDPELHKPLLEDDTAAPA
ncbi:transmembrane protein 176l.4 [Ctenopharyngodon idella]|uniref:transmembrane protein 176l.4 n=1 Tax=Ctenopharyngodon idella TaxID=7959 RepID=UPI00222ECF96|nr:transmembrane protein 176l.4 [Ctenopharyngodon idella]